MIYIHVYRRKECSECKLLMITYVYEQCQMVMIVTTKSAFEHRHKETVLSTKR